MLERTLMDELTTPNAKVRLILFAHGSRDPRWKDPFEALLKSLQAECGEHMVALAYMEMTEPRLHQQVDIAVDDGIERLTLLPLFMAAGAHLRHDVPLQIQQIRQKHPNLAVELLPPVGEHHLVQHAIQEIAKLSLTAC